MSKADEYLKNDIEDILNNGYMDVDPRPKYEDGTPAHTLSVNHKVRRYDLSKGEFPLTTLRRQAVKNCDKRDLCNIPETNQQAF